MLAAIDAPVATSDPRRDRDFSTDVRDHVARLRAPGSLDHLELPVLPEAARRVWTAVGEPDSDARLVADLVRRDATFATHVLRIANSPAYAARTPITSLQQAVSRLGVRAIGEIAMVIACKTRAFHVPGHEAEVKELFRHSFLAGLHAREIARLQKKDVEQAFLGALLHDVGRPTLIQALVDHESVSRGPLLSRQGFEDVVTELHAEIGAGILAAWGLPPTVAGWVTFHHRPEDAGALAGGVGGAALVALADALAHADPQGAGSDPRIQEEAVRLNLYPEDVATLAARIPELACQADALL